jgi:hypothetical protein
MPTAATSLLGLALPVTGELSGVWGQTVNDSITTLLDSAVAGTTTLSTDADVTLTTTTLAANQARQAILLCSGARTALRTITAPAQSKIYTIINATTGGYSVKLVGVGPTTGLTIPNGASAVVAWNGSDFIEVGSSTVGNLTVNGNLSVTGTTSLTGVATLTANPVLSAGTANGVAYLNGSKVVTTGSALTFDGTSLGLGRAAAFGVGTGIEIYRSGPATLRLNNASVGAENAFEIQTPNSGPVQFTSYNSRDFAWSTTGSEQMRLTSTGLGIGTSSPATRLSVDNTRSDTAGTGWFTYTNAAVTSGKRGMRVDTNNIYWFDYYNGSSWSAQMGLDSSGNLGLGVTPSAWDSSVKALQVGSGAALYDFGSANVVLGSNTYYSSTGNKYIATDYATNYQQNNGAHIWYTAASGTAGNPISFTQAMTLDASGRLGIGTTSPQTRLVVSSGNENIEFSTGNVSLNGGVMEYINRTTATTRPDFNYYIGTAGSHKFFTNGSERARIDSNGNFLVGTAAISTTATDGFLYIPTCAGTPTGTPTTKTGLAPMVIDSTNNKMYIYSGGAWRALN